MADINELHGINPAVLNQILAGHQAVQQEAAKGNKHSRVGYSAMTQEQDAIDQLQKLGIDDATLSRAMNKAQNEAVMAQDEKDKRRTAQVTVAGQKSNQLADSLADDLGLQRQDPNDAKAAMHDASLAQGFENVEKATGSNKNAVEAGKPDMFKDVEIGNLFAQQHAKMGGDPQQTPQARAAANAANQHVETVTHTDDVDGYQVNPDTAQPEHFKKSDQTQQRDTTRGRPRSASGNNDPAKFTKHATVDDAIAAKANGREVVSKKQTPDGLVVMFADGSGTLIRPTQQ